MPLVRYQWGFFWVALGQYWLTSELSPPRGKKWDSEIFKETVHIVHNMMLRLAYNDFFLCG